MTRRRRRVGATRVTVVAVLLLAGCSSPSPQEELTAAIEATAATPVTFELGARADRGALDALGDGAEAAADFLDQARVTGARAPDGRTLLAVTLAGDVPLLEVVTATDGELLLRTGLADLLPVGDGDPAAQLDPILAELGVAEPGRRALAASFSGGWVAVTDVDGLAELVGRAGSDQRPGDPPPAITSAGVLEAVTVTGARDAGDVRRLDVEVDVGVLLGVLGVATDVGDGTLGDRLPGSVALRDGLLQELRVELADDADDAAGVVTLVLTVTPVEGDPVPAPDVAARLTADELVELVETLQGDLLTGR